jgi:hypothetical protein
LGYPFTAGAAISAYRIVAMNANNTVVTANRSNATKQIGVAVADINSGQQGVIAYSGAVQVRAGMKNRSIRLPLLFALRVSYACTED